ncbi:MAG: phospho-sugar mutase, partial [Firmicutes bacterium]|nr:phospho-sugar mutase [Bacillota bacterium]
MELKFGTAGIRGIMGPEPGLMNNETVRLATLGVAGWLKTNHGDGGVSGDKDLLVVISRDSRNNSLEFAEETARTLAGCGIRALMFKDIMPVPVLSFAVRHLNAAAGVVITASHNPPQYNGYKVYGEDGAQVGPEAAEGITRVIRATKYTDCVLMDEQEALDKGLLKIIGNKEVDDDYIAQVKTLSINPDLLRTEGP